MKRFAICPVLFVTAGLLVGQQDEPRPSPKEKQKAKVTAAPGVRFNPTPVAIIGASGDTVAVAASRDGKRIASVGGSFNPANGFLSVIDADTKKDVLSLRTTMPHNSIAITPDGKRVIVTGQSADLKCIEVESVKTTFTKKLDGEAVLAMSPSGLLIATVTQSKTAQLWDQTGTEVARLPDAKMPLRNVAFSRDGKRVAAGGGFQNQKKDATNPNGSVYVWDVGSQKLIATLEGDGPAPITAVALSPDGALAAGVTLNDEQRIWIWDIATGKVKSEIPADFGPSAVQFSPDGKMLAAAMGNGDIRLWDMNGQSLGMLSRHAGICRCLAFIDSGKIVSGGASRSLKLWNIADKKELATLRQNEGLGDLPVPLAMAANDDGSLIALATEDRGVILRNGNTGDIKAILNGHEDAVTCVAFSPDGQTLATASIDKTIKLWDTASLKERATLHGHTNWVYVLAFSHDGTTLASGGYDKRVRFWDAKTGEAKGEIEAHRGAVRAVAFSPDDTLLATGGSDRSVKLWNVADRQMKFEMKGHEGAVRALAFSQDGKALASGGDDALVKLWNPAAGKELVATKKVHQQEVTTLAFIGNQTVISGGADPILRQWEVETGDSSVTLNGHNGGVAAIIAPVKGSGFLTAGADRIVKRYREDAPGPVKLLTGHTGTVQWASFSPDGKLVVSCGNWPEGDKTIRVWDVEKGAEILKIDHPGQAAMALFSPNAQYIASTSGDSRAYLWNAKTGEMVRSFKGHRAGLNGLAFNKDGSQILTSSSDKTARLWETATANEVQKFTGHTELPRRVAFHPDGKHALSAGRDGLVRMWSIETGKQVKQFESGSKWADCLAVSKDGKYMATGGSSMRVFDIESGKLVSEGQGHQFGLTHIAFSTDGKRLLSASYDGSARLWGRDSGKELYRFRGHREFLWCASFSPDNQWIVTAGGGSNAGDGKYNKGADLDIRLWKMPDERTMALFGPEQ